MPDHPQHLMSMTKQVGEQSDGPLQTLVPLLKRSPGHVSSDTQQQLWYITCPNERKGGDHKQELLHADPV